MQPRIEEDNLEQGNLEECSLEVEGGNLENKILVYSLDRDLKLHLPRGKFGLDELSGPIKQ